MAKSSAATGGGKTGSRKSLVVPNWDDVFGPVSQVDQDSMTACEIREKYRWGADRTRRNIAKMLAEGKIEEVTKFNKTRTVKSYRIVKEATQ